MTEEERCKVVFVGEAGTGKTSMINTALDQPFVKDSITTAAPTFSLFQAKVGDKEVKMELWDTAGQEKFRTLNRIFYKNAKIAIIVYDITRRESFEEIEKYWISEIKKYTSDNISKYI